MSGSPSVDRAATLVDALPLTPEARARAPELAECLATWCSYFWAFDSGSPTTRDRKRWARLSTAADELRRAYVDVTAERDPELESVLRFLQGSFEEAAEEVGGRRNEWLEEFVVVCGGLYRSWTGREPGWSIPAGGGEPGGAFGCFLHGSARLAGWDKSPAALRQIHMRMSKRDQDS